MRGFIGKGAEGLMKENVMQKMRGLAGFMQRCVGIIFLVIFLPVLFCVFFIGNRMDYFEVCKITCVLDNVVIALLAAVLFALMLCIYYLFRKVTYNKAANWFVNGLLAAFFVGVYFLGVEVSKCIAFYSGWDVSCLAGTVYNLSAGTPIGGEVYYSMYPYNVPIVYFMQKAYDWAKNNSAYPYNAEFIWIQMNNAFISIAGFASCMTVKRLTKQVFPTIVVLGLYVACVVFSPWKIIPYTDMMAIAFPILCICLYLYSLTSSKGGRYLYFALACLAAAIGALIKSSVYIMVVAIILTELVKLLKNMKVLWKEFLIKCAIIVICVLAAGGVKSYTHEKTGFTPNKEISATLHHFFLMGLNEETTGGHYSGDVAIFGQYATGKERNQAELQLAFDRIKERGVIGYPYFLLRKLTMVFNDGTFTWGKEGGFYFSDYQNLTDAPYKEFLRELYWFDTPLTGRFNTYSQLVWFFILLGIPGICIGLKKDESGVQTVLALCVLGIVMYMALLEARARYLICFLPLLITVSTLGGVEIYKYFSTNILVKRVAERIVGRKDRN